MSASRSDPIPAQAATMKVDSPDDLPNVRRANRALAALWRSGAAPQPRLEAGWLEARALRGAARDTLGENDEWRTPFEILLGSSPPDLSNTSSQQRREPHESGDLRPSLDP